MNKKQKYGWARALLLIGGLISIGWAVVSLLSLFDVVPGDKGIWKAVRAFGSLGIVLVVLGGLLCRWNLPALRSEVEKEKEKE